LHEESNIAHLLFPLALPAPEVQRLGGVAVGEALDEVVSLVDGAGAAVPQVFRLVVGVVGGAELLHKSNRNNSNWV